MIPVFITGTGTGIGKTVVSSIICDALHAAYWKPVQAGITDGTDTEMVKQLLPHNNQILPEVYRLNLPASPHIAAKKDNVEINLQRICKYYASIKNSHPGHKYLVIEGAGGLLVPLNGREFVVDLILALKAKVILVSRNYLGSINHSLLTAEVCKRRGVDVLGWVFNDEFMQYEQEIAAWSGYPVIASIPKLENITQEIVTEQAALLSNNLVKMLEG